VVDTKEASCPVLEAVMPGGALYRWRRTLLPVVAAVGVVSIAIGFPADDGYLAALGLMAVAVAVAAWLRSARITCAPLPAGFSPRTREMSRLSGRKPQISDSLHVR
jgi:hypothetical protein